MKNLNTSVKLMESEGRNGILSPSRCVTDSYSASCGLCFWSAGLAGTQGLQLFRAETITSKNWTTDGLREQPDVRFARANRPPHKSCEGRQEERQSGSYPEPTIGTRREQIRGPGRVHGGEQGFSFQQDIRAEVESGPESIVFDQELTKQRQKQTARSKKLRVVKTCGRHIQARAAQAGR